MDHVHGVVAGSTGSRLIAATHYGLETSADGGLTWTPDAALGQEMVGGLVRAGSGYVAALAPMTSSGTGTMGSMPGMHMTAKNSTDNVTFSADGQRWKSSAGIPANASVAAIATGANQTVWVAVLGKGVFRSTDGGAHFTEVIPAAVPISELAVSGRNLLMGTPSGVFVTDAGQPSMPALAQLNEPVNDLIADAGCSSCVAAAIGTEGIAVSHDDGVRWTQVKTSETFDELFSDGPDLFGMAPSSSDPEHGLWRSVDGGKTWHRVLSQPLIDHMYAEPASARRGSSVLLAFQWGIKVFRSTDRGATWQPYSTMNRP